MKFKKLMALGLAMTMTVATLTACGSTDNDKPSSDAIKESETSEASEESSSVEESVEEESKEITFPLAETMEFDMTALVVDAAYPLAENEAFKHLQERANIKFNLTELTSTEIAEKANLMMAGGTYGDVMFKAAALDADKYGMEGSFIPLEDLIREYMPNLTALLDERNAWKSCEAADGHIYALPGIDASTWNGLGNCSVDINTKWLENLNLEMPTNFDELYEVLKAFKEQDANGNGDPDDEVPFIFRRGYGYSSLTTLMLYDGNYHYYDKYLTAENDVLSFHPYSDDYKEFLAWCAKCYAEGLMGPDCFTYNTSAYVAYGKSVPVGCFVGCGTWNQLAPEQKDEFDTIPLFEPGKMARSNGVNFKGLMITDKCENPEVIAAWADYAYSVEGGIACLSGLEGLNWEWVEEGKLYKTINTHKYGSFMQYSLMGGATVPCNWDGYYTMAKYEDPAVEKWYSQNYGGIWKEGIVLPELLLTVEEQEQVAIYTADLGGYINNYLAEVTVGKQDLESTWEDFKSGCQAMGADEMVKIYQAAYDRAIAE